jgi:hypothetical protein
LVDRYSATFEDPVSKRVTKFGVSLTKAARQEIESLLSDPEPMIRRCVWRYIGQNCGTGVENDDVVELKLDARQILQLFSDLRRIDVEEVRRKHRKRQFDK